MKLLGSFLLFLVIAFNSYGQNQVDLTLRYNLALSRYEVYARPNFSQTDFLWGSSQITVVAPASIANAAFSISSLEGGGWEDSSPIYAPTAAPSLDFHGIGSSGKKITLVANQEILLFTFTLPNAACVNGLRLYVNGTDPASNPATMPGDFTNVIYAAGVTTSFYRANYANSGTTCTACNLTAPTLSK
jgi:hypothetical protein